METPDRNARDSARILTDNFRFLGEKEDAVRILTETQAEEAVRSALPSFSSPPAPEEIAALARDLGIRDFVGFCLTVGRVWKAEAGSSPDPSPDSGFGTEAPARIAYLQNAFSDRAYRKFSTLFSKVAAVYFPGFREVAEEVYSGRCTHAILPTASSADGQILSFRRLIGRYDLKIAAAADIPTDEDHAMRFALLRRRLPSPPFRSSYLDLSAVPTDEMTAGILLSSIERTGASLVSANSHPSGPEEDRNVLDLTFDLRGADALALHLFLEGSHVRYETVGSYELL